MKILKWSAIVVLYVLIGWATALHQFRHGDWTGFTYGIKYTLSPLSGLIWPIAGLFVWSDVYLWDAEKPKASVDYDPYGYPYARNRIRVTFPSNVADSAKIDTAGAPLNPLEGK